MKIKYFLTGLAAVCLSQAAFAQITIADWTFDVSQPVTAGPIAPEIGSGAATAFGLTSITGTGGNPSSGKSFSGPGWNVGDYWQFQVSTIGFENISVSYDQEGSATGPSQFALQYSTDGVNFTTFGSDYSLGSVATKWTSHPADLSSIAALNNASTVYFRVIDTSTTAINGTTVGSAGTSRIDNFIVAAAGTVATSGAPTIFTDVKSTNVVVGRSVTLKVIASGGDPLGYQWYHPNLNSPLTDDGIISGSTSDTLTLNNVTTNQAGSYQVIVSNSSGSVTSSIANLTIQVPIMTNIAYLRTLQDHVNWAPTDTNTLYTVQGTVTTYVSMTGAGNSSFYVQDATGGINVFVSGGNSVPDAGSVVQVTGPLGQFNGLLELNLKATNPDHSVNVIGGGNPLPAPQQFLFSSLTDIPYVEAREGSLIVVSNVYLGFTNDSFTASGNITMTNLNGQVFTLFINAGETDLIGQPIPQFATSITGVLGQYVKTAPYTSGYELNITQFADLVAGTPPPLTPLPIPLNLHVAGNSVILSWTDTSFSLQSATNVNGPYSDVTAAAGLGTYTDTMTNRAYFYRLFHP